ncbi:MAG: TatD family hydrolase [Lentisphaeria bacterium]|nr:TatD family hydrolase [Lentisphaeria bacterium]
MFFTDSHYHFCDGIGMEEYVAEAREEKVEHFLLNTGSFAEAEKASLVAEKFPCIRFTAGVHPGEITSLPDDFSEETLAPFARFATHQALGAVGEIGLDFYYDCGPEEKQLRVFRYFLERALEWKKPVTVHCRDKEGSVRAYEIAYSLLKEYAGKGGLFDLHCYAGSVEYAAKFLDLGGYFGVGGMVTFRKAENIREIVRFLPLERLLLETDAPYLAPVPYRGKPNRSKYIPIIGEMVSTLKKVSLEECAFITSGNASRLFSFPEREE